MWDFVVDVLFLLMLTINIQILVLILVHNYTSHRTEWMMRVHGSVLVSDLVFFLTCLTNILYVKYTIILAAILTKTCAIHFQASDITNTMNCIHFAGHKFKKMVYTLCGCISTENSTQTHTFLSLCECECNSEHLQFSIWKMHVGGMIFYEPTKMGLIIVDFIWVFFFCFLFFQQTEAEPKSVIKIEKKKRKIS